METNPLRLRRVCLMLMVCNSCNIGSGRGKGADVPAVDSVWCEGNALFGCLVDEDTGAWWGERSSVEVEVTKGSCI